MTKVLLNTSGTTDVHDIKRAKFDWSKGIRFPNSADLPFNPYGEPPTNIGGPNPPPYLFDAPITSPNGLIEFNGNFTFTGDGNFQYDRYLYLTYDVSCDANPDHILKGIVHSLELNDNIIYPYALDNDGLVVVAPRQYDTQQDGMWDTDETWMCDEVPLMGQIFYPFISIIKSGRQFTSIGWHRSALWEITTLNPGCEFTLGASSMGNATGYSNKYFDCYRGNLYMDSSVLYVNGRIWVGEGSVHPQYAGLHVFDSKWFVDGNDGTLDGSASSVLVNIGTHNFTHSNFDSTSSTWPGYDLVILGFGVHPLWDTMKGDWFLEEVMMLRCGIPRINMASKISRPDSSSSGGMLQKATGDGHRACISYDGQRERNPGWDHRQGQPGPWRTITIPEKREPILREMTCKFYTNTTIHIAYGTGF